ncbi:MAG: DUF2933 domain-containing protein [Deltaproteobacteria bacterium]|nr:DUF2933 domain-containing protein [Deltaproteobacteria bacterium]
MATEQPNSGGWWRSRSGFVLLGFLAIAAFFLWTEHRAHLLGILPYVLLLLCPLLHFLHGGHGGHGGHQRGDGGDPK